MISVIGSSEGKSKSKDKGKGEKNMNMKMSLKNIAYKMSEKGCYHSLSTEVAQIFRTGSNLNI